MLKVSLYMHINVLSVIFTLMVLHHDVAKCGHPLIGSPLKVIGYDGLPADIGTTIDFTCPPDLSLIGPTSATCTGNGEWTPDPSGVMCKQG